MPTCKDRQETAAHLDRMAAKEKDIEMLTFAIYAMAS